MAPAYWARCEKYRLEQIGRNDYSILLSVQNNLPIKKQKRLVMCTSTYLSKETVLFKSTPEVKKRGIGDRKTFAFVNKMHGYICVHMMKSQICSAKALCQSATADHHAA
jgi:hypothetical protein